MESITDIWAWITAHQVEIAAAVGAAMTLASVIVRLTPSKKDDEALGRVRAFLERLSFLQPRDGQGLLSLPGAKARRPE